MFLKIIKNLNRTSSQSEPAIICRKNKTTADYRTSSQSEPAIICRKKIYKFVEFIISLIMPKSCLICNKIILDGYFCSEDFDKLHFISKPNCKICGQPFEFEVAQNMICAVCIYKKPKFDRAISILKYDEISKNFILSFKYQDKTQLAGFFANLMFIGAKEILADIDFVTPVALHKNRLRKRKFNHSALIAKNFAKIAKLSIIYDLLIRQKNTKPQFSLSKLARKRNISGAFIFNIKYLEIIKGKNILIIDDVITTGVTIDEYCKVLRKFKIGKIYDLTLAKTTI